MAVEGTQFAAESAFEIGALASEGPGALAGLVGIGVLVLTLGALVLAFELVLLFMLALALLVLRVLLRLPWRVVATSSRGHLQQWKVTGRRDAKTLALDVAQRLKSGADLQ